MIWVTYIIPSVLCRSAFFCFCNDERPKVRAAHPNMAVGDVAKELGKRWESVKDKSHYEKLAMKDKERYERVWDAVTFYIFLIKLS